MTISDKLMRCTNCNWTGAISEVSEDLCCPNCGDDELEPVSSESHERD